MEIMFDKRLTCPNHMTFFNSNQPTLELVALTTYPNHMTFFNSNQPTLELVALTKYPNHMTFLNMEFIFDYKLACPNHMTLLNMESKFDYAHISMYQSEDFF